MKIDVNTLLSAKIITYNRGEKLRRTLRAWNDSLLREIPLEILDNTSTDSTPQVIAAACAENPHISHYRHKNNIGGIANTLRAYERFDSEYCWLLCDDDELVVDQAHRLLSSLKSCPDVVLVSSVGQAPANYGYTGTCADFIAQGGAFCYIASFLPGMVFRRALLDGDVLFRCYRATATIYPQAALIDRIIEVNSKIHCLEASLVNRIPANDHDATWVDWVLQSLLPSQYMKSSGALWVNQFVVQCKFYRPWRVLYQVARTKMYKGLPLDVALLTNRLIPWRHLRFKLSYLACLLVPRFVYLLLYRLAGKWRPYVAADATKRI